MRALTRREFASAALAVRYRVARGHLVTMRRGPVEISVTDNEAVGPEHRAGYNGIASLVHEKRRENLFVPRYAGLNFEFIHDGTNLPRELMFEPRSAPMELRVGGGHEAELYQAPTPHWQLESRTRFTLERSGAVRMRFECIPRAAVFRNGYLGLFWASYIHQPESTAIQFLGREASGAGERWIEAVSPAHGVESTHVAAEDLEEYPHAPDFSPQYMVFSRSRYVYTRPFYFGVSHGMACVFLFRRGDGIRFSQSPSGGGAGNPAWDFQWFIPRYEVNRAYGFEMRLVYVPYRDREQLRRLGR